MTGAQEPPGGRLTDRISLGVLSAAFSRDLIEEVIDATGKREKRSRLLPAHVMVRCVIGLGLFFGQAYEEVMRQHGGCASIALPGEQRDAVRGAVREPMAALEHRHNLVVLGQARGVDDLEPVVEGFAVGSLNVADLGLQGGVDVHQVPSVSVGAAPSAAIWPVTCWRTGSAGSSASASR